MVFQDYVTQSAPKRQTHMRKVPVFDRLWYNKGLAIKPASPLSVQLGAVYSRVRKCCSRSAAARRVSSCLAKQKRTKPGSVPSW